MQLLFMVVFTLVLLKIYPIHTHHGTPMMLRKIVTVQLTIGVSVMDSRGCVTVGITLKRNLVYITVKLGLSIAYGFFLSYPFM